MTRPDDPPPRRRPLLVVALALTLAALSACGGASGDDGDDGVASLDPSGDHAGTGDAGDNGGEPVDPEEAALAYDRCMAERGFPTDAASGLTAGGGGIVVEREVDDPPSEDGAGQHMIGPGGLEVEDDDVDAFLAADHECQPLLREAMGTPADLDPEQQAAIEDANLRLQRCLDDAGLGIHIQIGGPGSESADLRDGLLASGGSDGPPAGDPPTEAEQAEADAAVAECMKVFDEYPELDGLPTPAEGRP